MTEFISSTPQGHPANGISTDPSISGNGRYVAFLSTAPDLVDNDMNATGDIFVRGRDHDISVEQRCDDGGAIQGTCYGWVSNNTDHNAGAFYRYKSRDAFGGRLVESGDHLSAEMLVWCGAPVDQECDLTISIRTFQLPRSGGPSDQRDVDVALPGMGNLPNGVDWYICRLDANNVLSDPYESTYDYVEIEVTGPPGSEFGIDDVQLRGFQSYIAGTIGDPDPPELQPVCHIVHHNYSSEE